MARFNKTRRSYKKRKDIKKRKSIKKTRKNKGGLFPRFFRKTTIPKETLTNPLQDETLDKCSICRNAFSVDDVEGPKFTTTCNHDFHEKCLMAQCKQWEEEKLLPRCPICRKFLVVSCNTLKKKHDDSQPGINSPPSSEDIQIETR